MQHDNLTGEAIGLAVIVGSAVMRERSECLCR